MNKATSIIAVLVGLGTFACVATAPEGVEQDESALEDVPSSMPRSNERTRAGEFIVVFNSARDATARGAIAARYNANVFQSYENVLSGFAARMSDADAQRIAADPAVKYVVPNGIKYVSDTTQTGATWGIDRVDQVSLPLDGNYSYRASGRGVNAVVIDTGVDKNHPDFEGRVAPGFNALTTGAPDDAMDVHGHGTHVAGTMASKTWGLAKSATIVPVRVCNAQGQCTDADIIRAVDWVTANVQKPAVVNMSLGGQADASSQATEDAIRASIASGITYVVAAGNDNRDACGFTPARMPEVITTGATARTDGRASFSNWGTCLDVFAPGSSITSARRNSTGSTSMSGTSMASPHAAGVVALLLEDHPEATPAEMEQMIRSTATPDKVRSPGTGSPNLLLHVDLTTPPPPPPPPADDAGTR